MYLRQSACSVIDGLREIHEDLEGWKVGLRQGDRPRRIDSNASMKLPDDYGAHVAPILSDEVNRGIRGETLPPTLRDMVASERVFVRVEDEAERVAPMLLPSLQNFVLLGKGGVTDEAD